MKTYTLETSPDRRKWTMRARFQEGQESRFGKPFDEQVALLEAKAAKIAWTKQPNAGYDDEVRREIHDRSFVRIIIEI